MALLSINYSLAKITNNLPLFFLCTFLISSTGKKSKYVSSMLASEQPGVQTLGTINFCTNMSSITSREYPLMLENNPLLWFKTCIPTLPFPTSSLIHVITWSKVLSIYFLIFLNLSPTAYLTFLVQRNSSWGSNSFLKDSTRRCLL